MTRSRQRKQARPGDPPPAAAPEDGDPGTPSAAATTEASPEAEATGSTGETGGDPTGADADAAPGSASEPPREPAPEPGEPVSSPRLEPEPGESPPSPMSEPVAPPPRSWWPSALGGGIIGGIIVGIVVGGSAYYLLSEPRPDPALVARVARVESRTEQIGTEAGKVGGLAGEVGDLQARIGSAVADPAIMARLQKVEGATSDALQQIHDLDTKVSGLAKTVDGLPKSQPDLGPLEARIKAVEDGVAKAQAAVGTESQKLQATIDDSAQALQGKLDSAESVAADLGKKLGALEDKVANLQLVGERGAQLALAVGDAEQALRTSASLEPALARLRGLAANDPELGAATDALAQASSKGITPVPELRQRLEALRPALPSGASDSGQSSGWAATAARNLGKLVTVQKVDEATEGQRAAVDQALAALDRGDLASARDAIAPLARSGDERAAAWVQAAATRLDAAAAIDRLRGRVQAILTAAS